MHHSQVRGARDLRLAAEADTDEDYFEPTCCVWLERDAKRFTKRRVTPVQRGSNPEWNRTFHFKVSNDVSDCVLVLEIRNSDRFASKQVIGRLKLNLSILTDELGMSSRVRVVDSWYEILSNEHREYCGEVNIRVEPTLLSSPKADKTRKKVVVVEETPPPRHPPSRFDVVDDDSGTSEKKKTFEYLKRKSKRVQPIHLDWSNLKSRTNTHMYSPSSMKEQRVSERTRQDLADAWLDTFRSADVRSEWEGLTNDGDRQFDLEEFEYLVRCLLPSVSLRQVGLIFDVLKLNDSGTIRWIDFLNFIKIHDDDGDVALHLNLDELEPLDNRIENQVCGLEEKEEEERYQLMRELEIGRN